MSKDNFVEIIRYENRFKDQWDSFVEKAKNSTFLFKRDFIEYHKDRFDDFSLLVFKERKLVALLPANFVLNEVFSHQGISYGGFIVKKSITFELLLEIVQLVLNFYKEQGFVNVSIKLIPDFYDITKSRQLEYILYLLNAQLYRRDSYYVIPSSSFQLNRNRKRALEKANKCNFIVKQNNDFICFWDSLLTPNLQNRFKTFPTHTKEEILYLHNLFPENILFFGLYEKEELKAGVVLFLSEHVAHFQYSSGANDRSNGALDFLFHYIIQFYKDKKYISFGSSSENNGKKLNIGLALWKESFGAQMALQDFYCIKTENNRLLENVLT